MAVSVTIPRQIALEDVGAELGEDRERGGDEIRQIQGALPGVTIELETLFD